MLYLRLKTSHLGHLFLQDSKTHSVCSSSSLYGTTSFSFLENFISTMFSRAGKLIYFRGQDEFFHTGNEPNGVGHLSQPYNKDLYIILYCIFDLKIFLVNQLVIVFLLFHI